MPLWTLETDSGYTSFNFPTDEDKVFFADIVENYIEESKPVSTLWHPLIMIRGEPMKHPDFFSIDETDVIAMSQHAVESLNRFLNDGVELLPIETDAGRYYALNVLNYVDCLNKEESEFESTKAGIIVKYTFLEFHEDKIGHSKIFKIPEMPYQIIITQKFAELSREADLKGLFFDKKVNLLWYAE